MVTIWQAIYGISATVKWSKSIILETKNCEELLKLEVHCWFLASGIGQGTGDWMK